MDYGNSRTEYVCTGVEYGHNEGTELTDNDGNDVAYNNSGGITLYTCYNGWQNVVIAYFTPGYPLAADAEGYLRLVVRRRIQSYISQF